MDDRVNDRPDDRLFVVLVTGLAAIAFSAIAYISASVVIKPTDGECQLAPGLPCHLLASDGGWVPPWLVWVAILLAFLGVVIFLPFMWVAIFLAMWIAQWPDFSKEDRSGVATIVLAAWSTTWLAASIIVPLHDWLWAQFLVCLTLIVIALLLVAINWSQKWLIATGIVFIGLFAVLLIRVGSQSQENKLLVEPIEAAISEMAELSEQAKSESDQARRDSEVTSAAAIDGLNQALSASSNEFQRLGISILNSLNSGSTQDLAKDRAALFSLPITSATRAQDVELRTKADDAIKAYRATRGPFDPPSPDALKTAIDAACRSAPNVSSDIQGCLGAEASTDSVATETSGAAKPPEAIDPSQALHNLSVQLAYYRLANSPDDEALKAAASAIASAEPDDLEVSLVDALNAGPAAVIASVGQPQISALLPNPWGWLALGLLAVWGSRQLLKLNAKQMPGPVSVEFGKGQDDQETQAALRIAVLQNLKTPSASPGSGVVQSVTDLSQWGSPEQKGLAALASAVGSVLTPSPGYVVTAEVSTLVTSEGVDQTIAMPNNTTVLVSVQAASSNESLATQSFTEESKERAVRAAGLWAAGFLLERSSRIPSWASWTARTAKSLGVTTSDSPTLSELEKAARDAPTSGWILQLYGNQLELNGRAPEAIAVYARAVASHPRYYAARYRLATSLGMLSRDSSKWTTSTLARQKAISGTVKAAGDRIGVEAIIPIGVVDASCFRDLAVQILKTIEEDSMWPKSTAALMRKSDRDRSWLIWRGQASSSRSRLWLAKSAYLAYAGQTDALLTESTPYKEVVKEANRPKSSWQVSYNLACALAEFSPDAALDALETCLRRPGIEQLDPKWVRRDPDLKPLASLPRFELFCSQLREGAT